MTILQLAPRMPYPLTDGGAIGICSITKWLKRLGHEVTLITFPLDSKQATDEAINDLGQYADVRLIKKPLHPRWCVLLRTLVRGAYPIERRQIPEMYRLIESTIGQKSFDIVHVDHSHMGPYGLWIKDRYGLPIVLREHNFEALIYERYAERETNPVKSYLARLHGGRLKREEARFLTNFDAVAAISQEDVAAMKQVAPEGKYRVIPAGVDIEYFKPRNSEEDPNSILSLGTLEWDPNFDATRYFLDAIFPIILQRRPATVLHIVGFSGERILPFLQRFGQSVQVHGRVPDVRDYLARAAVLVVPLRIGGGMRLKLLEAFAAGKAIVSTSIGAEGNEGKDGIHLWIRDGAESFADAVVRLLSDSAARQSLGINAHELAVTRYGWDHVVSEFVKLSEEVLRNRATE
ncbi:MAG: glycosyltransferase family 4 protein [Bacteroidota bacterium]|nr:glycosyltransferase family 4 protein [Bacteroidota bacterium]